jgi:hypothetical protein
MDAIQSPDGNVVEDWYRLISEGAIGKVICFIKDNNLPFKFTNLTPEEIDVLRNNYLNKQKQISDMLKLKSESINVDNEDFSYLKIDLFSRGMGSYTH